MILLLQKSDKVVLGYFTTSHRIVSEYPVLDKVFGKMAAAAAAVEIGSWEEKTVIEVLKDAY